VGLLVVRQPVVEDHAVVRAAVDLHREELARAIRFFGKMYNRQNI
jgi:hypothetical protein